MCPGHCFDGIASASTSIHTYPIDIRAYPKFHYKTNVRPQVWVRGFEDRIDLLSVMIAGPKKTPYEDGLFVFDVQLGGEYPRAPPLCHYHSYCTDRLNPNLYEDGKVSR